MTNECTACGLFFGSVAAFDTHRIGDYPQTGPADWLDRIRAGLVDVNDDWQPTEHFGRRCLEPEELEADPRFLRGRNGWSLTRHQDVGGRLRGDEARPRTSRKT